ncbi:hypothetical protein PSEUDO8Z_160337 [Pseudomonas sp. 8Z]|nr:hypothetical protein PSEUDO8Z_160337 [Pseudomonas sp. 8Z]
MIFDQFVFVSALSHCFEERLILLLMPLVVLIESLNGLRGGKPLIYQAINNVLSTTVEQLPVLMSKRTADPYLLPEGFSNFQLIPSNHFYLLLNCSMQ